MDDNLENLENFDLENLIIKDKIYYKKKRKKILLISIPIILVITIVIILIFVLKPKPDNKIICHYQTLFDNENINLININNDIDYNIIIDDINYGKKSSHNFNKSSTFKVIFDFKNKLDSLEGFFKGNKNLIIADFSKLQIDNIISMADLFNSCDNLKEVFFDNKTPNLKSLSNMFYNCISLNSVQLNIDTSKVEKMDFMFKGCSKLIHLDISNNSLKNLVNSSSMFNGCTNLKEIKFNNKTSTINLENMNSMFKECKSLEFINTNIFKTNKVTNLSYTFAGCEQLLE